MHVFLSTEKNRNRNQLISVSELNSPIKVMLWLTVTKMTSEALGPTMLPVLKALKNLSALNTTGYTLKLAPLSSLLLHFHNLFQGVSVASRKQSVQQQTNTLSLSPADNCLSSDNRRQERGPLWIYSYQASKNTLPSWHCRDIFVPLVVLTGAWQA